MYSTLKTLGSIFAIRRPLAAFSLLVGIFAAGAVSARADDLTAMREALNLRTQMTDAIASGDETPASAIARLKAASSPTGLKINRNADFAFAALDIGQRLVAAELPAEAEEFFREAEKFLDVAAKQATSAPEKVQYLLKLAHVRGKFLNKPVHAKSDLEQALALRPNDAHVKAANAAFASEHGQRLKQEQKR